VYTTPAVEIPASGAAPPIQVEEPSESSVRAELERILSSRFFYRSERLRRFLSFITEVRLAGRIDEVNEYAIATQVYDRGSEFDPAIDSIVRVEARRLRLTLGKYYSSDGWEDAVWITIPKGGYEPWFRLRRPPLGAADGFGVEAAPLAEELADAQVVEAFVIRERVISAVLDVFRSPSASDRARFEIPRSGRE